MKFNQDDLNRAFNEGCDARIVGLSRVDVPYDTKELDKLRKYWLKGWSHVNKYWGKDSKIKVSILPNIRQTCNDNKRFLNGQN